ncbi:peptidylprolyl isomerase [Fulvivirgaceae bacterium BMA10]|uniref:Peptidyl-prolyl cis-trans isomerase n=1 Tax=Splendidivirga corallicola TaxID=3051826 RepID=A0ABT8KWM9_9BACT|nr:peptidylprolyl isomerase [Fulvivirgaceae bacterium BMA10]
MKKINFALLALSFLFMAASCQTEKEYLVTIKTPYGDMKAILYDETPKHKENFIKLAKEGFYDSLLFHRIISEFMIQGGDPNSKNAAPGIPLGSGGPDYTVPAEFKKHLFHKKGALAAARTNNPEKASSSCQFYIVQGKVWSNEELTSDMNALGQAAQQMMARPEYDSLKQVFVDAYNSGGQEAYGKKLIECKGIIAKEMNVKVDKDVPADRLEAYTTIGGAPHLDDEYTVFGIVVEGLDIIDKIAEQPRDGRDRPNENITMVVELEEVSKKKITKTYGYQYPAE